MGQIESVDYAQEVKQAGGGGINLADFVGPAIDGVSSSGANMSEQENHRRADKLRTVDIPRGGSDGVNHADGADIQAGSKGQGDGYENDGSAFSLFDKEMTRSRHEPSEEPNNEQVYRLVFFGKVFHYNSASACGGTFASAGPSSRVMSLKLIRFSMFSGLKCTGANDWDRTKFSLWARIALIVS